MENKKQAVISVWGVQVYVGENLRANSRKTLRLGSVAVRYLLEGNIVTNRRFDVVADLDSCIEICGFSDVRHDWEKAFRTDLAYDPVFRELGPDNVLDYFVVRLNPTNKLYRMGWKDKNVDMRMEMRNVYLTKNH